MDITSLEAFVAIFTAIAALLTWRAPATLDDPAMAPVDEDLLGPLDL